FEDLKSSFHVSIQKYDEGLQLAKINKQAEINAFEEKKKEKLAELAERKAQQDPEPGRHPATKEARKTLAEQRVKYAPLYEVIEFQPDISSDIQKRIESALIATGMLDALVTEKDVPIRHDRILI